jgi:predicted nucleotidyltransferase
MVMDLLVSEVEALGQGHSEILAVYLFGSWAEGVAHARSDLDLAVLLRPEVERADYADHRWELLEELSRALHSRLDLIILNQAPPLLQFQVLQKGRLLYDRDPDLRAELEMHMLSRYYDARRYIEFHYKHLAARIRQRGLGRGCPRDPSQVEKAR